MRLAPPDLQSPETAIACAVLLIAALATTLKVRGMGWWERPLARLAAHRRLALLTAAAVPLLLRMLLLYRFPAPEPRLHDEFSFLLGAQTILAGRLANPSHPFWPHFESMHILARPTYSSAFPPGQASALAVGLLVGHPWIGVWLSVGLMCSCVCWMLQGWLPPRWALLGALLLGVRLGVSSYWMNSYWGGALAAAGGALILGSLTHLRCRPDWRQSLMMGVGLAILAFTRSFEGAVFALVSAAALLSSIPRTKPSLTIALRQVGVPLALSMTLIAGGLCFYFLRVTGNPRVPPYVLYRSSMTVAPHFLWQRPRPEPLYNNREMRQFYAQLEMNAFRHAREAPFLDLIAKAGYYWRFFFGPLFTIPLLTLPLLWRDRRSRPLLLIALGFSLALAVQVWHNAHYAAPATGLLMLIAVLGMRRVRVWRWRSRRIGLYVFRLLPAGCLAMLAIQVSLGRSGDTHAQAGWRWPSAGGVTRARIVEKLQESAEKHLIFVRYGPWHEAGDEWVYNNADIDASKVVWARELDRFSNTKLTNYFGFRRVWLIEPDVSTTLKPYERAEPRAMPFVAVGAPGIESLRSPDEIGQRIRARAGATTLGCDQWNYYFTEVTGVMGPDVSRGCYSGGTRDHSITFQVYFSWLLQQR